MFVSIGSFTNIIQRIADARSENGAEQNRLGMVNELLIQNQTNLEAAYGRIMDADMALESTRFAKTKCTWCNRPRRWWPRPISLPILLSLCWANFQSNLFINF